ncbi:MULTISPECIES: hypothetical protein [Variovorax]|uniref:hypothetical protein n=1 Tax=Variovorax TaxID=34072 RepID=UPI00285840AE|nr:hypothetical protein [Variovorax sp. 3319]MDR6891034.1 hypothetical protein [Variovorax sp. 3319]
MNDSKSLCRVCGFDCFPFLPWGEDGNTPSYALFQNCNVEFGYETLPIKESTRIDRRILFPAPRRVMRVFSIVANSLMGNEIARQELDVRALEAMAMKVDFDALKEHSQIDITQGTWILDQLRTGNLRSTRKWHLSGNLLDLLIHKRLI